MKRYLFLFAILAFLLTSCGANDTKKTETTSVQDQSKTDPYFSFSVDGGQAIDIPADDVLANYTVNTDSSISIKIFAGKDGASTGIYATGLNLFMPKVASLPSSTPNGSAEVGSGIDMGSVYLTHYPTKNIDFISFNTNYHNTVIPDAIVVTGKEPDGKDHMIVTGVINAITYPGLGDGKGPDDKNHTVTGKFRVNAKSGL